MTIIHIGLFLWGRGNSDTVSLEPWQNVLLITLAIVGILIAGYYEIIKDDK